jgi:hypothetical protein
MTIRLDQHLPNIEVEGFDGLIVDIAAERGRRARRAFLPLRPERAAYPRACAAAAAVDSPLGRAPSSGRGTATRP